ncbi:DUF6884 domain-containing protein [Micromonospora sp. RV43]|uniref:DUF6884 domain-containing protein n=1 Tax=Micromonospora sp. RV43 TaxID=1661387 RepID=UPI00069CC2B0|nr:DUF6884 domain-containing protein [Micromonospora sp. RV43]
MPRATVVSVGPKFTRVTMQEGHERRVSNDLVQLDTQSGYAEAYGLAPHDRPLPYGRYAAGRSFAPARWLPRWSWMGWTVAEHLAYAAGLRPLDDPPAAPPKRLVIVGCGGKKSHLKEVDAHGMYVGSYHRAARRAADALVARDPGRFGVGSGRDRYQVILSAKYGLLDLFDVIERYDLRMGEPGSVTADTVRYQAQQLGLLDVEEVIVLAGRKYADVVSAVWPHALRPLDGTAGVGPQLQRLAAIAATGAIPTLKEFPVRLFPITETLPADVYPARLDAGDVIDVPGRGRLTLASQGGVWSSAKPTWMRFKVVDDKPFDVDSATMVRLIAVGEPKANATVSTVAAGSTIECPHRACRRQAKVRRDGKIGAHNMFGTTRCELAGEPVPSGVKVVKQPAAKAAGKKPTAKPREIPLTEVTWGMFGRVKCMGPDGSRTESEGYVSQLPRLSTRGVGCPQKLVGEELLSFDMSWPSTTGKGGCVTVGLKARPGTKFTILDAPADRPFTETPSDSRRMIVRDMRAGDLVGIRVPCEGSYWGTLGPELLLTCDPKPYGDDHYELTGLVAGEVETYVLPAMEMLGVDGPAVNHLIEQDPNATLTVDEAGVRALPAPGETDPGKRWKLLGEVSSGTSATAVARRERMFAAMRLVHELPCDASHERIRSARDADNRIWTAKCADYWDAYAMLLAEDGGQRTAAAEPVPAGHVDVEPDAEQRLEDFFAQLEADLSVLDTENAPEPENAEARMLAKVAERIPADVILPGPHGNSMVMARWVANGLYATAIGVDENRKPVRASGFVVEAHPLRGGYGGWHPDATVVVKLANLPTTSPTAPGVRMVQVERNDLVEVVPPADGRPLLRMPTELQILEARTRLGLSVEVVDGPANELWRVEGCPEQIASEVAWWLFGGTHNSWEGRSTPVFRASRVAEAIHAGRYTPPAPAVDPQVTECATCKRAVPKTAPLGGLCTGCRGGEPLGFLEPDWRHPMARKPGHLLISQKLAGLPLLGRPGRMEQAYADPGNKADYDRLLLDGQLVDMLGRVLTAVDCELCSTRRPHQKTSGITCPYEVFCPTCQVGPNQPCRRPSGHKLSEAFGGLHETRAELAYKVDDARVAAGDMAVPAPWPTQALTGVEPVSAPDEPGGSQNAGRTLDGLLAQAGNPRLGRYGRQKARELAERYAAGLPLVRFNRLLDHQWMWNCPVPTCGIMRVGHDTIREARAQWFEHAGEHEGFVASWPDDVLPVEEEQEQEQEPTRARAKRKKLRKTAVIEITEPVGNDWWDDAALAWERCGTLHRTTVRRADGREVSVAVLTFPQGRAKAAGFAELLASIGGIDPGGMHVRTLDEPEPLTHEALALFDWDDFSAALEAELSRA